MRKIKLIAPELFVLMSIIIGLLALIFNDGPFEIAFAGPSTIQNITYEIEAINEITVSDDEITLTIDSATAGSDPNPAWDNLTSYSITTNQERRISGQITGDPMPVNTALSMSLAAPTNAVSPGLLELSNTTAAYLVTSIDPVSESTLAINYRLTATAEAGVVSGDSEVTLTIASN